MTRDLRIIAIKELQEILTRGRSTRGGKPRTARRSLAGNMLLPAIFGVLLGVAAAHGGTSGRGAAATALFPVALLALNVTGGLGPDAIAGERERHTLEALLATPVSDGDILGGKLAAVVGYGWLLAFIEVAVVELAAALTGRSPFGLVLLIEVAILALLEAILSGGVGVLVSIRAPTVRAAQRSMAVFTMITGAIAGGANVGLVLTQQHAYGLIGAAAFALVVIMADGVVVSAARRRFVRSRLLLD
jgi:ABC-type Na+ efflux pump permease subunit